MELPTAVRRSTTPPPASTPLQTACVPPASGSVQASPAVVPTDTLARVSSVKPHESRSGTNLLSEFARILWTRPASWVGSWFKSPEAPEEAIPTAAAASASVTSSTTPEQATEPSTPVLATQVSARSDVSTVIIERDNESSGASSVSPSASQEPPTKAVSAPLFSRSGSFSSEIPVRAESAPADPATAADSESQPVDSEPLLLRLSPSPVPPEDTYDGVILDGQIENATPINLIRKNFYIQGQRPKHSEESGVNEEVVQEIIRKMVQSRAALLQSQRQEVNVAQLVNEAIHDFKVVAGLSPNAKRIPACVTAKTRQDDVVVKTAAQAVLSSPKIHKGLEAKWFSQS